MEAKMNTRSIFAPSDVCVAFENDTDIDSKYCREATASMLPRLLWSATVFTTGGTYYNRPGPNMFLKPSVVLAPILSIKFSNLHTHVRVILLYLLSSKVIHEIDAYGMAWQAKRKLCLCFGCASAIISSSASLS